MSLIEDCIEEFVPKCPYCGAEFYCSPSDYSKEKREVSCGSCDKKYYLRQHFFFNHLSQPDCVLNGEAHDFKEKNIIGGQTGFFCDVCGRAKE